LCGIRKYGAKSLAWWLVFSLTSVLLLCQYDEHAVLYATKFGFGWFTNERLKLAARVIHSYGDIEIFVVALGLILYAIGKIRSNAYFTRTASSLFLAGAMAGIGVQVIKFSVGRPRPPLVQQGKAHAWSFAGPTLSAKYRSYPSGHSTSVATAATVIALAFPRMIPLAIATAFLVGASRVIHNYHYPTDVLSGLAFGMAVGGICARHLARLRERLHRRAQWLASSGRQKTSSTQELSAADQP